MELLFASANAHKIEEIKSILPAAHSLKSLSDIGFAHDIPETGSTIKENSFLKAKYISDWLGEKGHQIMIFADDSGLEVEALNGAPGVYSARYAGVPKSDDNNNNKLLQELKSVTARKARFVTVITLLINDQIHSFEGEVLGTIAYEARGKKGFGYDPLFIPRGYRSTFAELGSEVKNNISHRAMAVKKLVEFLTNNL